MWLHKNITLGNTEWDLFPSHSDFKVAECNRLLKRGRQCSNAGIASAMQGQGPTPSNRKAILGCQANHDYIRLKLSFSVRWTLSCISGPSCVVRCCRKHHRFPPPRAVLFSAVRHVNFERMSVKLWFMSLGLFKFYK